MKDNWADKINIDLLINKDEREVNKFYYLIHEWIMFQTEDNEELSNDIFIKILDKIHLYDEQKSGIHNFIFTITKNEIVVNYRKKNYIRKPDVNYILDEEAFTLNHHCSNEAIIFKKDIKTFNILSDENIENQDKLNKIMSIYEIISEEERCFLFDYLIDKNKKKQEDKEKFLSIKQYIMSELNTKKDK